MVPCPGYGMDAEPAKDDDEGIASTSASAKNAGEFQAPQQPAMRTPLRGSTVHSASTPSGSGGSGSGSSSRFRTSALISTSSSVSLRGTSAIRTPQGQRMNPFDSQVSMDTLHLPTFSPSVFSTILSPSQESFWSVDQQALLFPAQISDDSPWKQESATSRLDPDTENKTQEAINLYFSQHHKVTSPEDSARPMQVSERLIDDDNGGGQEGLSVSGPGFALGGGQVSSDLGESPDLQPNKSGRPNYFYRTPKESSNISASSSSGRSDAVKDNGLLFDTSTSSVAIAGGSDLSNVGVMHSSSLKTKNVAEGCDQQSQRPAKRSCSTRWTQTLLTLPVVLPAEVEQVMAKYLNFELDQEQQQQQQQQQQQMHCHRQDVSVNTKSFSRIALKSAAAAVSGVAAANTTPTGADGDFGNCSNSGSNLFSASTLRRKLFEGVADDSSDDDKKAGQMRSKSDEMRLRSSSEEPASPAACQGPSSSLGMPFGSGGAMAPQLGCDVSSDGVVANEDCPGEHEGFRRHQQQRRNPYIDLTPGTVVMTPTAKSAIPTPNHDLAWSVSPVTRKKKPPEVHYHPRESSTPTRLENKLDFSQSS